MTQADIKQLAREIAAEQVRMQSTRDSDLFHCSDLEALKKAQHKKLMADRRPK